MTLFCLSTAIVTIALLAVLVYALCAAAARADEVGDKLMQAERQQRAEKQAQWQSKEWMKP